MNQSILNRIKALGGNIEKVAGESLEEDLQSITFDTVLYQRPSDTPWSNANDQEPIYGLGAFIEENNNLVATERPSLHNRIIEKYYCQTKEGYGQFFWKGQLFTPFRKGTADYDEWYADFTNDDELDLELVTALTNDPNPDFIQLFYSYRAIRTICTFVYQTPIPKTLRSLEHTMKFFLVK